MSTSAPVTVGFDHFRQNQLSWPWRSPSVSSPEGLVLSAASGSPLATSSTSSYDLPHQQSHLPTSSYSSPILTLAENGVGIIPAAETDTGMSTVTWSQLVGWLADESAIDGFSDHHPARFLALAAKGAFLLILLLPPVLRCDADRNSAAYIKGETINETLFVGAEMSDTTPITAPFMVSGQFHSPDTARTPSQQTQTSIDSPALSTRSAPVAMAHSPSPYLISAAFAGISPGPSPGGTISEPPFLPGRRHTITGGALPPGHLRQRNMYTETFVWDSKRDQLLPLNPGDGMNRVWNSDDQIITFPPGSFVEVLEKDGTRATPCNLQSNEWMKGQVCGPGCTHRGGFGNKRPILIREHVRLSFHHTLVRMFQV
jgi:hypothetical protein